MEFKDQNIFSKVDTRSERQRAYGLLLDSKDEIQIQFESKEVFRFKPLLIKDARIKLQPLINPATRSQEPVIASFGIGAERYFLRTTLYRDGHGEYFLDIDQILYKLQRRNSFRVNIPSGYGARIEFLEINGQLSGAKFLLADLSAGGFAIEVTANQNFNVERDQVFSGKIMIGGKFEKRVTGVIRHIGTIGSKGSGLRRIGIEFQNLSAVDKEAFMKITWDIHRDMFSTFKIGSR